MRSDWSVTPISNLFPAEVVTALANPHDLHGQLYPQEESCITRAVPKRVRQFTAGRLLARAVLAEFGILDFPLLIGPGRAPVWPPEIVGSIAHTEDYCGVVAARHGHVLSVGLDIESDSALEQDLWPLVLTPSEQNRLDWYPPEDRGRLAKLIFSAKECVYKCQFPRSKQWVDFQEVEISLDMKTNSFTAQFLRDVKPFFLCGTSLTGKFCLMNDHLFTGMTPLRSNYNGGE